MDIVTTLYNVSEEKIFFILLAFSLILGIGKRLFMLKKCYNYIIAAFLFFYPFGFLFGIHNTLGCAIGLLFCILLEKAFSYKPSK